MKEKTGGAPMGSNAPEVVIYQSTDNTHQSHKNVSVKRVDAVFGHGIVIDKQLNKLQKKTWKQLSLTCLRCDLNPTGRMFEGHMKCGIENCPIRSLILSGVF
jgi:hypothetical protein